MKPASSLDVNKWLEEHQGEMIYCPRQPGLLLITKKACLKRYRAALSKAFEGLCPDDLFHYTFKKGLSLCEGCPLGKKLDEEARTRGSI